MSLKSLTKNNLLNTREAKLKFSMLHCVPYRLGTYIPSYEIYSSGCMNKIKFTIKRAKYLGQLYCDMSPDAYIRNIIWGDLVRETGAHTTDYGIEGGGSIITMNRKSREIVHYLNDIYLWAIFTHELAHVREPNHSKVRFGVELARTIDFMAKYGHRAARIK